MFSKIDLRFCSARSVGTSLLFSHNEVFIIISGSTMFSKIDLRLCSEKTVDTLPFSSHNKVFTATSGLCLEQCRHWRNISELSDMY